MNEFWDVDADGRYARKKAKTMATEKKSTLKIKQTIRDLADKLEPLVEYRRSLKKKHKTVFDTLAEIDDSIGGIEAQIKELARKCSEEGSLVHIVDRDLVKVSVQGKQEYDLEMAARFWDVEVDSYTNVKVSAEKVKKLIDEGLLDDEDAAKARVAATPAVTIKLG